jgi:hypothetical protein
VLKPLIGASCSRRTAIRSKFYVIEEIMARVVFSREDKRGSL